MHYIFHRTCWAEADNCYLQDLFTDEASRGLGVGATLIEAVRQAAAARGVTNVYWMTHETNARARRLYDRVARRTGFIEYDLVPGSMFLPFFLELKAAGVPTSLREYLGLLEGLEAGLVDYDVEGFYFLARAALVKDERHIDRFDRVFAHAFKGVEAGPEAGDLEAIAGGLA